MSQTVVQPSNVPVDSSPTPAVELADSQGLLARLEQARKALASWQERFADYSGNNPDKYRTDINNASNEVARLTELCKRAGVLEATPAERMGYELDKLHPDAKSREVVLHEGRYFQKRFSPGSLSRSRKTVTAWEHRWDEVPLNHVDVQRLVDPAGAALQKAQAEAVRKHWPWSVPAGGLQLRLQTGEPALVSAVAGKSAIGYTKGRPDLRVSLTVTLVLTVEALERCRTAAREAGSNALWLGRNEQGQQCFLVKTGRAAADIGFEARTD